jgi:thiol-disulfide isomerase/thioredoxin
MNQPRCGFRLAAPLALLFSLVTAALMLDALHGPRAPQVQFAIIGSDPVRMESLTGAPLVVNFWATTCSICRSEMPKLAALYEELRPGGLELIGVAMPYDPPNLVAEYARRSSIPYPVSLDIDAEIVDAFGGVKVTPTTFLIGPDSRVLGRYEGRLDFAALRRAIRALITQPRREVPGGTTAASAGARIAMEGQH